MCVHASECVSVSDIYGVLVWVNNALPACMYEYVGKQGTGCCMCVGAYVHVCVCVHTLTFDGVLVWVNKALAPAIMTRSLCS